jgi:hypothetical protein
MFIKLDHFNYINKNKKGSNVVGTKFGTQENLRFTFTPPWVEDDYCPHSIFYNLQWEWYPNGISPKPHESGSLEIWNFGLLKLWEVITFFKYVQLKHICDKWSCIFFKKPFQYYIELFSQPSFDPLMMFLLNIPSWIFNFHHDFSDDHNFWPLSWFSSCKPTTL